MNEKGFEAFAGKSPFPEGKTVVPGGYMGKILLVNLATGKIEDKNLPGEDILRKWPGGQGLGQYIFLHMLRSQTKPLSQENVLCFMTGPLTGTGKTPAGTVTTTTTLGNIVGNNGSVVSGSAAGYWGAYLKFSGYDGIVITGASSTPVYLWVTNGRAELRDARHLWGKDSHETVDLVKAEIKEPEARIASIGPAGENLVGSAMVLFDHHHSASHGGGAIMGFKKLKAIAVYGTARVPIRNKEKLVAAGDRWRSKVAPQEYPRSKTTAGYGHMLKTLVVRNWQTTLFPEASKDFDEQEYIPRPCYQCNRECPHDARITTGKHAGYVATMGAGSENMEGAAYVFGVGGNDVRYLTDVLDRMGMEAGLFGCAAAPFFEAYEKGVISKSEADGLELKWGDAEVVEKLMKKVAFREGKMANLIAEGPGAVAKALEDMGFKAVTHIKGGAPAMHDWRPYIGQMLGQLTSGGGGKPRFQGFEVHHGGAPDLGYKEKTDRQSREGKAHEIAMGGRLRILVGCLGSCYFGVPAAKEGIVTDIVDAVSAVTGWSEFSKEEALEVGERVWQMEHIFHLRYGFRPEDDIKNIGARFLEPVPDGPFQGFTIAGFLPGIVHDFYREFGWDVETGRPSLSVLKRLGMEEFAFMAV